jgi:hypothetical protein
MPHKATDRELAVFVAENLHEAPIGQRAGLCWRIADLVSDPMIAAALRSQAASLDEIAADHRQLLLNLRGGAR